MTTKPNAKPEEPQRPDLDAEIKRLQAWLAELSARVDRIEHKPNLNWRIK